MCDKKYNRAVDRGTMAKSILIDQLGFKDDEIEIMVDKSKAEIEQKLL